MPLTLTVGTNTYISLADAETYMESRYDCSGAWAAASNGTKNILLVQATKMIDRQPWRGSKTASTQSLEFPRDGYTTADTEYDKVEGACVEQALWLLSQNPTTRAAAQAQGVQSLTVPNQGPSEAYRPGGAPALCPEARDYLKAYYIRSAVLL